MPAPASPLTPSTTAPLQPQTNLRYAWYVAAILAIANISGNIDRQILGLLVRPIEADLGITDTQMSLLQGFAFAIFYAILGLPIARLADRSSRRNIMAAGVALWSFFTALQAATKTYLQLLTVRLGVGIGEATLNAPSVSLLADYFPRERLSRAMSVYQLGVFFGSGVAYYVGGWALSVAGSWQLPIIGPMRPWQSVLALVGLPGLVVALLMLTIREPGRTNRERAAAKVPFSSFVAYVRANARAYLTHGVGFGVFAMVNYAIAAWIPTFFLRTYGWREADAARVMGVLTMTIGVAGVIAGGWLGDRLIARGKVDGPIRVGVIAAIGMLITATVFPLMPTPELAIALLAIVNFFAAFPWGAASAAAAEMAPAHLRSQGAALYFFALSLISGTLGPTIVALFTDHVFGRERVGYSLAVVTAGGMLIAVVLLVMGLDAYRRTLANRELWSESV
jgi:MFS family permease